VLLRVPVGVGDGEQMVLMPLSHAPGYGSATAHVLPPSTVAQLPYTVALPGAGRKSAAMLATLCQLTGADDWRTSA
jgi:hypothetical protein